MATQFISRVGGTLDPVAQLTQAEQDNNIRAVHDRLHGYGWSDIAIAGACGCFVEESHMNPGIYETGHGGNLSNLPYFPGGMGLAQWTDYPAYTAQYPNPLAWLADKYNRDWWDGDFQCYLLNECDNDVDQDMGYGQGDRWGWMYGYGTYPYIPFTQFKAGTGLTVDTATEYWFYDFEWHTTWHDYEYLPQRKRWAAYAYQIITGHTPEPPGPGPGPTPTPTTRTGKMPLWMYLKRLPF